MIKQNVQISSPDQGWWLIFSGNQLLQLHQDRGLPDARHLPGSLLDNYAQDIIQVGEYQQRPCYLLDLEAETLQSEHAEFASLRQFLMVVDQSLFQIAARAWQVALFLRTHRFCGQCGSRTHRIDWELAVQCSNCQHRCYPRVSPCIIVAVRKGKQILLAQGQHHREGLYSTLAGFVESGETLEQAVHREVMEEVGIKLTNLRYFASQPWPFPHSLMMGFLADYASGDIQVDGHEILRADWFDIDDLPLIPGKLSIAGQLIEATCQQVTDSQ